MKKKIVGVLSAALAAAIMATPVSAASEPVAEVTIQGVTLTDVNVIKPDGDTYTAEATGLGAGAAVLFFGAKGVYTDADVAAGKLALLNTNLVQISDAIANIDGIATATFGLKELGLTSAAPIATIFVSGGTLPAPKVAGYVNGTDGTNGKVAWGDVNENDATNATDASLVLRFFGKKVSLLESQQYIADVNGSKTVNATDASLILRKYGKKITQFPVEPT